MPTNSLTKNEHQTLKSKSEKERGEYQQLFRCQSVVSESVGQWVSGWVIDSFRLEIAIASLVSIVLKNLPFKWTYPDRIQTNLSSNKPCGAKAKLYKKFSAINSLQTVVLLPPQSGADRFPSCPTHSLLAFEHLSIYVYIYIQKGNNFKNVRNWRSICRKNNTPNEISAGFNTLDMFSMYVWHVHNVETLLK